VQAIQSVVEARAAGPFSDIFDFCERVDLRLMNRRVIESLIQGGAIDALPGTRAQKMATLDRILARAQRRQSARDRGQGFLGFSEGASANDAGALENVSDWDESTRLHREKESLGFYFSGHPLDRYAEMLGKLINVDSLKLKEKRDREAVVGVALVTDLRVILDRKGNPMAFVTVEDVHGSYEIIAFSDCYQKRRSKLQKDQIVVVTGKISVKDRGDIKIIADEVYTIEEAVQMLARKVHLTIRPEAFSESGFDRLKETLDRFPGEREIIFHIRENGRERGAFRARLGKVSPGVELLQELNTITGVEHVEISS
jgi:DNA polymerase-3 subunit alpha